MKLISADGTDPLLHLEERRNRGSTIKLLDDCSYTVGQTRVYCWFCTYGEESKKQNGKPEAGCHLSICRLIIYAGQTCLMSIGTDTLEEGQLIFDLVRRYELSPYHVEDVLEDREIHAYIHWL